MKRILTTAGVVICCILFAAVARADQEQIGVLDGVSFDGTFLQFTYTVQSGCPASTHKTAVTTQAATPAAGNNMIRKFNVVLTDSSDESACGVSGPVVMSAR